MSASAINRIAALALVTLASASTADAHTASRGFVMQLPTTLVIISGALAVTVSCGLLAFAPRRKRSLSDKAAEVKQSAPVGLQRWTSCASSILLFWLVWRGFTGPGDPLSNPLSLAVWTAWWIVLVVLHAVFGNLWSWINPFTAPLALIRNEPKSPEINRELLSAVPILIFAVFAWWQLVFVTPADPPRLAILVLAYVGLTVAGAVYCGMTWFQDADPFFLIFRWIGALSPIANGKLRFPGQGLSDIPTLNPPHMLLLIMLLGTLSFDGLANSFFWLSSIGVNPLDFEGRGSVMWANTFGLFAFMAVIAVCISACIFMGWCWSGQTTDLRSSASQMVLSLIPIAVALHFSHFLPDVLVNGQYLLGSSHDRVTTSFLNTASGATTVYAVQTSAVVLGHVIAVAVCHNAVTNISANQGLSRGRALQLELPMALFMITYTGFSLWSLSTPSIG